MAEHRIIEKVLESLSVFAQRLEPGRDGDRQRVADYARFFSEFADRCHHGKEEDRLFVSLEEHGFPRDTGPVAMMLYEHELGRTHVQALAAVGAGSGTLSDEECESVRRHAREYVPLLAMHIQKEDEILFPHAVQVLPDEILESLGEEFEDFETRVMGPTTHAELHELAEELISESSHSRATEAGPS
jgi:hemerythrin-like domain-containing protein